MPADSAQKKPIRAENSSESKICGIIMPISPVDDCPRDHWEHVKSILSASIEKAGLQPKMVNESNEVAIIHRTIVQNVYNNVLVICDLSHKNPNVMLELGMRLAFGKHVVLVKDDKTQVPFDAGVIEYIEYPRDLRHPSIECFIESLAKKIQSTYAAALKGDKTTFLEHFKEIKTANIEETEVSLTDYLEKNFSLLYSRIADMQNNFSSSKMNGRMARNECDEMIKRYFWFCNENRLDPDSNESFDSYVAKYPQGEKYREVFCKHFKDILPF